MYPNDPIKEVCDPVALYGRGSQGGGESGGRDGKHLHQLWYKQLMGLESIK